MSRVTAPWGSPSGQVIPPTQLGPSHAACRLSHQYVLCGFQSIYWECAWWPPSNALGCVYPYRVQSLLGNSGLLPPSAWHRAKD